MMRINYLNIIKYKYINHHLIIFHRLQILNLTISIIIYNLVIVHIIHYITYLIITLDRMNHELIRIYYSKMHYH